MTFTIVQIRERLRALLPTSSWHISDGTRTISAKCVSASEAIATSAGIDVVAQFWMSSPPKRLAFEIAGDVNRKMIREQVAEEIRSFLIRKGIPKFMVLSKGSTICRINVATKDSDMKQAFSELDGFISYIREQIGAWVATKSDSKNSIPAKQTNSIDDLADAPSGNNNPDRAKRSSLIITRDAKVREYIIRQAKGRCEYCREVGFLMENGKRYLEAHHIIALANQGEDTTANVIALCPEHHKQAHFGKDAEALEKKFLTCIQKREWK